MPTKTVVAVTTISGGDALVYSDGSISSLVEVNGVTTYFVAVPVDIEAALLPADAGNETYAALPGYVAPSTETEVGTTAAALNDPTATV